MGCHVVTLIDYVIILAMLLFTLQKVSIAKIDDDHKSELLLKSCKVERAAIRLFNYPSDLFFKLTAA